MIQLHVFPYMFHGFGHDRYEPVFAAFSKDLHSWRFGELNIADFQIQQLLYPCAGIIQHNHQEQIPDAFLRSGIRLCQQNLHFRFTQKFNTGRFRFLLPRNLLQLLVITSQRNIHHGSVSKQCPDGFELVVSGGNRTAPLLQIIQKARDKIFVQHVKGNRCYEALKSNKR